jgi:acyl CoA:acetate/3-ketoacid CoA transferase alpha subunit/acyl CoA:acetate/3-ketoacid CoA transferase beta subunit
MNMREEEHGPAAQDQDMEREDDGKVLPLDEAIRRYVKPGMSLHLAGGIGGPSAAICEIVRQYQGISANFELIQSTVTGHALHLIHSGLLKKMVFAACMEISEGARPSRVFQRAYKERRIEVENWSLCSLQQRLMAGAMGLPFLPTKSISGSSMASDLKDGYLEMSDPFGKEGKIGLVKALRPDISIVHGCAADRAGNTILGAPVGDDLWGAFASKSGALITVEKIVTPDFIRKHSSLVKIPAYAAKAVCVAPFGAHPFSIVDPGIADFDPYGMDHGFLADLGKACGDPKDLDTWIAEWIIACSNHGQYVSKLGSQRTASLRREGARGIPALSKPVFNESEEYSAEEMMLVATAREIIAGVGRSQHKLILVGAGSRAVGSWLAYYQLRDAGYEIDVMTGNGQIGYTPLPGEAFLQTVSGLRTSKMLTDTITTHGVMVAGVNSSCISVLGAAQIDPYANINSTRLAEDHFLVGSGGGNDSANAPEVIVVMDQSRRRFVEELPYVTSPGDRVTSVVSSMGIFRKKGAKERLRLAATFPDPLCSCSQKLSRIKEECGWTLETEEAVRELSPPTHQELGLLRWLLSTELLAPRATSQSKKRK